jgi:hypothetical protein
MSSKASGAYTHYLQAPCRPGPPINKVRTMPFHPLRVFFNNPDRKAYVVENRNHVKRLLSIHVTPWTNDGNVEYFTLEPFSEETFYVNTGKEMHQYLRIHDPETYKVLDSKFLNPVYSLISIMGDVGCQPKLQLQMTPGW